MINRPIPVNLENILFILSKLDVQPGALISYPVCKRGPRAAYRK